MDINSFVSKTDWVVAFLMLLGVIGGIIYFFIGDKLTRIEHKNKINEIENLLLDLLILVLESFKKSEDNTKVLVGNPSNYESKITNLVGKLSNIGCCSKRRFKNYIECVRNYNEHWGELVGVNTSSESVKKFTKDKEKIIKCMTKLGNATGRHSETRKYKNI